MASAKCKGKKRVSDTGDSGKTKKAKMGYTEREASSSEAHQQQQLQQPFTFRLMDLPPELRLEIYRACLTRPFDVLLARNKLPVVPQIKENGADYESEDDSVVVDDSSSSAPTSSSPTSADAIASWTMSARRSTAVRLASTAAPRARNASTRQTRAQAVAQGNTIRPAGPVQATRTAIATPVPRPRRPQDADPLIVALLRTTKQIYKEARPVLYSENTFILALSTALPTLSALHQRSRGQIRHLRLTIPTHNEILERFAEVVRLSLRYCWRLKSLVVNMPFVLPGAEGSGVSGNASVYANAFDILRWLPRQCEVVLEGQVCEEIREVVERNARLAKGLDELAYARRQLISNEGDRLPISDPPLA